MNRNYIIVGFVLLLVVLFFCLRNNLEYFTDLNSNLKSLKEYIEENLNKISQYDSSVTSDVLQKFKNSQKLDIKERLTNFKQNIDKNVFDNKIIDEMYFDLRLNDDDTKRLKLIYSYSLISSYIKEKGFKLDEDRVIDYSDENKNQILKLLRDYSKFGKF